MEDVLVIGAGPTGLTSACELARHGIRARIVDKAAAPSEKSKAFAVHARTLELFENIGIVQPVLDRGQPSTGIAFYDTGELLLRVQVGDKIASKYPFIQIIPQSATEAVLLEHLQSFDIAVEREVELQALSQDADHVTATLRHKDGRTEEVMCRYLIGNDGAHSVVRKQLGLAFEGSAYPNQWLLADIELDWGLPYEELSVFFHATGSTAFFPLEGKRGRLMFEVPNAPIDVPQPEPTIADVERLCTQREIPFKAVTLPTWLAWFRLHHRIVDRYGVGRVFVGGDAAHIHSPIGGQGMNMGIQDAYNLAWKLALVLHGKARPQLLDSYGVERLRTDRGIVGLTHRATSVATIHNPVFNAIRRQVLKVGARFEGLQERIAGTMAQIEVHYRDSPIVRDVWPRLSSGSDLRAGERVPDFPLGDTCLYDLLTGAEHELLMFHGEKTSPEGLATLCRIAHDVADRYGPLIELHSIKPDGAPEGGPDVASKHVDPDLAMHRAFGASVASVVLVRPDGYIAFRNQPADPDALASYLTTIFAEPAAGA